MKKYEKLREVRKEKKMSLETLAKNIGVSKQYLWDIEDGRRVLSYLLAFKIAYVLGVRPDYLFLEDTKKGK